LEFHISYRPWQHFLANCMQRCVNFTYEHVPAHVVFPGGCVGVDFPKGGMENPAGAEGCSQKY